jgi:uncharacterized protein
VDFNAPGLPLGTLVNVAAVMVGSGAGLLLHRGFPERYRRILLSAGGLATLALGAQMAIGTRNPLVLIGSLYSGALIGEALGLEARLERAGEWLRAKVSAKASGTGATPVDHQASGSEPQPAHAVRAVNDSEAPSTGITGEGARATSSDRFTEGLSTAFLIFCVGPMTIVGALNEGLRGDHNLLLVKSTLDLFTSFALASSFGLGVLASVVPLALFQLALTAVGYGAGAVFTEPMIVEMMAVGGALIIGLGLNLLDVTKLRISNLLPALIMAALLAALAEWWAAR